MQVKCFHALADVAVHRAEINALNLDSERPDPFSTYEFIETFVLRGDFAFAREPRLWLLMAFDEGRLLGYLALKQVTQRMLGMRSNKLGCLTAHEGDRPRVIAAKAGVQAVSAAFYAYLLSRKKEWSYLEFEQQDAGSTLIPPVDGISNCLLRTWPNMPNCSIAIRWTSLQEYFHALSKKFRSNISRQMRALFAAGNLQMLGSSDPCATPALLELYLSVDRCSWKSAANLSIAARAGRVDFIRSLLAAQQPMQISIQILLLDGVPIAGLINGSFDTQASKGLYALHIAYDRNLSELSPGAAILLMGVRQAIAGKYAFYNLLAGFEYYKSRWLADVIPTRSIQIYRIGTLGYWRRLLGDGWRRMSMRSNEEASYNSTRREFEAAFANNGVPLQLNELESKRIESCIAQARRGDIKWLTASELAASLPFAVNKMEKSLSKSAGGVGSQATAIA